MAVSFTVPIKRFEITDPKERKAWNNRQQAPPLAPPPVSGTDHPPRVRGDWSCLVGPPWLRFQSFFHHHHHHHHRSSMVPATVPRLLPESGSLLGGIAQITPNLFLSRGNVASNRSLLLSKGITCVVNATIELPNFNWPHMEYVKVPLADMPHSPISLYFDSVADKIHSVGRKRGAVLVHCAAGVSRSASLCLAYLMKYQRVSLAEAHAWVKARRPVIRPNSGFWRQLIEYERMLFGRNSVKMVQTPYGIIPDVYERDRRTLAPYWGL
ncbi:Dual specificity protein phosphatase 14 [Characodon lateralis]|uniref:Dual specificity protein phosphatase 14 n=1 Tax=Characodon lateralis TaxID=208331 RepID=A0ABU7E7W3_9TELE|nr:Dual specificity protein phosphatase 14 [Characodon lateralis]